MDNRTEMGIWTVHRLVWASASPSLLAGMYWEDVVSWLLLNEGDFSGGIRDWWFHVGFVALQLVRILVFCTVFPVFSHWSQDVSSCCLTKPALVMCNGRQGDSNLPFRLQDDYAINSKRDSLYCRLWISTLWPIFGRLEHTDDFSRLSLWLEMLWMGIHA